MILITSTKMATNPYIDLVIKATKALPKAGTALAKKASRLQPLPPVPARTLPIDIVPKEMERTGMGTTVLNKFSPQVETNRGAVGSDPIGDLASRGYEAWREQMKKNLASNPSYGMTGVTNEKGDAIRNLLVKYVQDEARRTGTSAQRLYDRSRDEGELSGILKEGPTLAKNILWDAPIGAVGATFMGGTELAQGTPMGKPINKLMEALTFLPEKVRDGTIGIGKTPLIPQITIDAEGKPHFKSGGPTLENIIGTSNLTSASELLRDLAYGAEFGGIAKGAKGIGKRVGDADYREAFTKTALPELAPLFYGGVKSPSTSFAGTIPGGKQVSQFVEGLVSGEKALRDKVMDISTEVPTQVLPKNQKKLVAEANSMGVSLDEMKDHLKGQYDELLNDEIKYLQESSKQGVQQGGIVRDTEGGVVNRFGRQSNNPQWYRDFFAEKGRAPNKKELAQIAIQNLIKGSGEVPKNDFFIELKNKLDNIDGIKNATVFQTKSANTPEVQYAGNIKMKNIGSSDDARVLINLNAERFKQENILPAGDRVSLEQMRKEANDLAESTGLSRGVIEQWAKESEGNRSKITATRQELSDRASTATSLIQKLQLDPTNAELKTQVSGALKELQFLQVATNKMIAESARTLGANRIKTLETDARKIEQYIKDNLNKDPNALAEHLSTVPLKDLPKTLKQIASPGFIDRIMSVRQASLLTDPRTWERNILGNTAGSALRKIQKPLDILSDQIIKKVKGEPSARSWTEMNTGKYKKLLSSDTVKQWLEEYASSTNKYEGAESKRWLVEKGTQKVFDFLEFQDLFFKKAIAKDVIASSAKRTAKFEGLKGKEFDTRVKELLKSPTDSMFEEMSKKALEWTYQTQPKGRLYKTAKSIRDIPVAGKLAVPFLKTVWNLGRMALERTVIGQPLNLARMMTGKHSSEQALSNLLLATALQATISSGVEAGVITGTERDTKKRMLNEAEGIKDDLIKTPFGSFSYKNLEPVSTIIGSGVDLHNAMKGVLRGEQSVLEGVGQTSFSVADRFVNNSFLRGVSDLLDLIPQYNKMSGRGAEEKQVNDWSEYGAKQLASFYPRAFNWLEEIVGGQKVQRPEGEGVGMDKFLSGITNHLTASTPGISGDIPVKIDIWGNEVRKQQITDNPVVNNIINALVPVQIEKRKEDPVNAELLKLKYYPQAPTQTIDGYRMTNKEYEQYMKVVGKETKQKLDTLIGEEKYKNAQDSDKVDMIKKIMSAVKKEHKDMFFDKVNESKLKQLKEAQSSGDTVTAQNLIETMQKGVQKLPPRERETADSKRAKIKAEIKRKNMSESQRQMFSSLASEVQNMEYNEAKAHVLKKYPNINRVNLENFLVWAYSGAEF